MDATAKDRLPHGLSIGERELTQIKDILCDRAAGECPSVGCNGCLLDSPRERTAFVAWLESELKRYRSD